MTPFGWLTSLDRPTERADRCHSLAEKAAASAVAPQPPGVVEAPHGPQVRAEHPGNSSRLPSPPKLVYDVLDHTVRNLPRLRACPQLEQDGNEMTNKTEWVQRVLQGLEGLSRTMAGQSDTSSSDNKPKLAKIGPPLESQTRKNLQCALEYAWGQRDRSFATPEEVRQFIDCVASKVSAGLFQPGQPLYRNWSTTYGHIPPEEIEQKYVAFCTWLCDALKTPPSLETAALVEKRLDGDIHPFADGCGRTAKIVSAFVLLRADLPPVRYPSREDYYNWINRADHEWLGFYRNRSKVS